MPEQKKEDFICPICGSKDYSEKTENNGIYGSGGRHWVAYCICNGCSVVFSDPEKFSNADKFRTTKASA